MSKKKEVYGDYGFFVWLIDIIKDVVNFVKRFFGDKK